MCSRNYTPVESYYRLAKTIEGDPEFDVKKARKKLRHYVESHSKAIRAKSPRSWWIIEVIPPKVAADAAYQNAKQHSDRQNARIEHDQGAQAGSHRDV